MILGVHQNFRGVRSGLNTTHCNAMEILGIQYSDKWPERTNTTTGSAAAADLVRIALNASRAWACKGHMVQFESRLIPGVLKKRLCKHWC